MKLSIIIVSYNVKYFLEQCLNSILASYLNVDYEIIIVDNNSTDHSVPYLEQKFTHNNIIFIRNNKNLGFAKANNQAIQQARGKYILLLNPDTVIGENTLANVINFMDANPEAGAVGVKTINGSGLFLPESKRGFPTPWASFCKFTGLASLFPRTKLFDGYYLKYLDENKIHQIPILVGAFMMIRKTTLDKVGLLDESFFMYGEDIDLSYRITLAGYTNYYLPEKIIHYKGESTDKYDKKYINAFYNAMSIFYKKYYPNRNFLYSSFVNLGIQIQSSIGHFRKRKKYTYTNYNIILFDKSENTYENIINKMDEKRDKLTQFRIFDPQTGISIGTKFTGQK